jgi:hypothetical protein
VVSSQQSEVSGQQSVVNGKAAGQAVVKTLRRLRLFAAGKVK